jgi:hypothetical protein
VAATSGRDAWAVGCTKCDTSAYKTLIVRWNGTAWKQVPSPNPAAPSNLLADVAATSAGNAWAVGYTVPFGGNGPDCPLERHRLEVTGPGARRPADPSLTLRRTRAPGRSAAPCQGLSNSVSPEVLKVCRPVGCG